MFLELHNTITLKNLVFVFVFVFVFLFLFFGFRALYKIFLIRVSLIFYGFIGNTKYFNGLFRLREEREIREIQSRLDPKLTYFQSILLCSSSLFPQSKQFLKNQIQMCKILKNKEQKNSRCAKKKHLGPVEPGPFC